MNRRQFINQSAGLTVGFGMAAGAVANGKTKGAAPVRNRLTAKAGPKISVFTKPFTSLSFEALAAAMEDLGVDEIEAPIRAGGHVDLERVETGLPRLVAALKARGIGISIMASDINDPDDATTERVLKAATAAGIRRYRLKYFKYKGAVSIADQLDRWRGQLTDLAALNRQLGIQGLYQNHAGANYFGAPVWDLADVLTDIDPNEIGVAYDIRHATVEGGNSWPVTMRRIMPHVGMLYVKDFVWRDGRVVSVPLGAGQVAKDFYRRAVRAGFSGPISLHEEYLDHRQPDLIPQHLTAMKSDLQVLKTWIAES